MNDAAEEMLEKYETMTFLDDYMMKMMFSFTGKEKLFQKIVSIILDRDDITIEKVETQKQMFGNSKTVILDAYGKDREGAVYDIEIQKYNDKNIGLRARAYGDIIDMEYLTPGKGYDRLPTRYVIFICDDDPFRIKNKSRLIRHFKAKDDDDDETPLGDNTEAIFVNCAYRGEGRTELLSLIHDMNCPIANDLIIPEIKIIMETMRTREELMAYTNIVAESIAKGERIGMEKGLQQGKAEGIQQGIEQGSQDKQKEIAVNMIRKSFSDEEISELTGLSVEEIRKLRQELSL